MLSIDPGGTTGMSLIEYDKDAFNIERTWQIQNGLKGFLDWHWDELDTHQIDLIVCEDFTLRGGIKGVDITPAYVIGALEALYPSERIEYQSPSMKSLCDNDRLKKMGIYETGRQHSMDAVRHGIIYLRNIKHKGVLQTGWEK